MSDNNQMTPRDKRNAHILCYISIACAVLPIIAWILCEAFYMARIATIGPSYTQNEYAGSITSLTDVAVSVLVLLSGLSSIAALVLMIVVRVKYPSSVFGKVLMWTYIALFAAAMIITTIVLVTCAIACNDALDECSNCQGMIIPFEMKLW